MNSKFPPINYLIFDGRYHFDRDRALVLDTCETLKEAKQAVKSFGDAVIVLAKTEEIIYEEDKK